MSTNAIDEKIATLDDWRGRMLATVRDLIRRADPEIIEDVKWRKPSNPTGDAVWSHAGMLCSGEVYRDKLKLTFAYGASLADSSRLFNASLDAGTRRAIDIREDAKLDEGAFVELIREAVRFNAAKT